MKLKVLSRDEKKFTAQRTGELEKSFRNPDPVLHPFERAREYTRALNATKLEKIFAKPFLCALDGHVDTIKCMAKCRTMLAPFFTGACDGEVRFWSLSKRRCTKSFRAHQGFVRGITTSLDDKFVYSCGDDKVIQQWRFDADEDALEAFAEEGMMADKVTQGPFDAALRRGGLDQVKPTQTLHAASLVLAVDHHWQKPLLVSCGETVDIWDVHRTTALHQFEWGCDGVTCVKFNPAEVSLIASGGRDNSIGLYDLRGQSGIKKVVLKNRTNGIAWNPMEPVYFTAANEDASLYTFDLRKLNSPVCMHHDHVMAVTDVDYSPSGREFVSASYDKTVRVFPVNNAKSREVYHTKRMQRVMCTRYSSDMRFILTGSEDMCVRLWKAEAAAKLGVLSEREKQAGAYRESLKEKFANLSDIKKIARHRQLPKWLKNATKTRKGSRDAKKVREANKIKHSKPGSVKKKLDKEKAMTRVVE